MLSLQTTLTGLSLQALIGATVELKPTIGFQFSYSYGKVHVPRLTETSLRASEQFETKQRESVALSLPDYLITDSIDLPDEERPTLLEALSNPREVLASTVIAIGTAISFFNIVGIYDETYLFLESCAISLGLLSSIAHLLQIKSGYFISQNIRRGIVDDAAINLYAAVYSAAVCWLALRTSQICPEVLTLKGVDITLASLSIGVFIYSLMAPILTLLADSKDDYINGSGSENQNNSGSSRSGNIPYQLSQSIVSFSRMEKKGPTSSSDGVKENFTSPPLSDTELLRARGLLFIGILGCIFAPDALSFLLGGNDWWSRVTAMHPSQQMLESSTSLFALFATESSMIAHRVGKVGVAKYETIVPVFAGVCAVLAIVPCVCALHWLGDDISFFSFYRE